MYIHRDITKQLQQPQAMVQILLGPRQCGKSTLFDAMALKTGKFQQVTFDDLALRRLANQDPALFLQQFKTPLLLDEAQYAPNLFPEIKKRIDEIKKARLFSTDAATSTHLLYGLTGSNQILMDKNVKETLVGRASYHQLNTLTVHEILQTLPQTALIDILFQGGWPELYVNTSLNPKNYLNDYIRSYLEKEIALTAGIQQMTKFHVLLGLLASRTGQLLNYSNLAAQSDVSSVTIKEWISILERSDLIYLLQPYATNLNKRLIKNPKIYFLDTGLATRLQGWQESQPLISSPQIGSLFETLALTEIIKFIRNYDKDWQLFFWRTKDGDEIDFILKTANSVHAFEVKYAAQNIPKIKIPASFKKDFPDKTPLNIITFGGKSLQLSENTRTIPLVELHDYLLAINF